MAASDRRGAPTGEPVLHVCRNAALALPPPPDRRSACGTGHRGRPSAWTGRIFAATPVRRGRDPGRSALPLRCARRLVVVDSPLLGLDQPATNRVAGQLDAVAHAELVEDVLAVALDGLDADPELLGDLLRG